MMTREEWLNELVDALRPDFKNVEAELPENIRATCGWPSQSAKSEKRRRIGECWPSNSSDDKHFEIFISPTLSDPVEVGGVLVQGMIHTWGSP